jgi:hypothetical protein
MRPSEIEIVIDELVLHGFHRADRHLIAEAIKHELATAFANDPGVAGIHSADRVNAGEFAIAPQARASTIGAQAGGAIHKGLPR